MTLTQMIGYRTYGTSTSLADGSSEFTTIYTVPAGNTMLVKESRTSVVGGTGINVGLYFLETGAGNVLHGNTLSINGMLGAVSLEAFVLRNEVTTGDTSFTIVAHNTVLAAGDSLRMRIKNTSGAAINATNYGTHSLISGDLV